MRQSVNYIPHVQSTTPSTTPFSRLGEIYFSLANATKRYATADPLLVSFIRHLDRAPGLKKLTLHCARIWLSILETINSNAPTRITPHIITSRALLIAGPGKS